MAKEKKEVMVIDFEKFSIQQLPELQGKKEEIKGIIDANPVVEIVDNASYELAKKSRTTVKTLRTGLQREQKEVNSRIKKNVLEVIANEYDSLIGEVLEKESERQEPITIYEAKKEEEKREKERLEQERIDGIKNSISEFKTIQSQFIETCVFDSINATKSLFEKQVADFDRSSLQEYEVLFDDAVSYLTNLLESTISTLTEKENIRIAQLEIEKEKERQRVEAEKIAEAQRLEREKFEKEQKAAAEKQRIAKEKFEQEKREFEEDKRKSKIKERNKNLETLNIDLDSLLPILGVSKHSLFLNYLYSFPDDAYEIELKELLEFLESQEGVFEEQGRLIEKEGVLFDTHLNKVYEPGNVQIIKNAVDVSGGPLVNYHEADVDTKGIIVNNEENLSENIVFESFDLTWAEIYSEWSINKTDCTFIEYLEQNFMVPERKQ